MVKLIDRLLDRAKRVLDCANDSELAKALGAGATRICNYRKGRNMPNPAMARRIARALGLPAPWVIAAIRRQKGLRRIGDVREASRRLRSESARLRGEAR
ncbi:MAG TPA: helix-turn-helix domain-containing protein, partial [Burkholderiales bacterium]|nr:helix-turn-helix domain-containing protein [Burkholderiales bacterium]